MEVMVGREEEGVWEKVLLGVEASSLGLERDIRQRALVGVGWVGGKGKDLDGSFGGFSFVCLTWSNRST